MSLYACPTCRTARSTSHSLLYGSQPLHTDKRSVRSLKHLCFQCCCERRGGHSPPSGSQSVNVPAFLDWCCPVEIYWEEVQTLIPGLPGLCYKPSLRPNQVSSQGTVWGLESKLLPSPRQTASCQRLRIQPWLRDQPPAPTVPSGPFASHQAVSYGALCPFLNAHLFSLESGKGTGVCRFPK